MSFLSFPETRLALCQACEHRSADHKMCRPLAKPIELVVCDPDNTCPAQHWAQVEKPFRGRKAFQGSKSLSGVGDLEKISESRSGDRPRVGIVYPMWQNGGVEQFTRSLIDATPGIEWAGLISWEPNLTSRPHLDSMRSRLPVFSRQHVARLARHVDLLLVWGFMAVPHELQPYVSRMIAIAHGEGEWTAQQIKPIADAACGFVSVCESGRQMFPAAVRDKVRVIHNGIDFNRLGAKRTKLEARVKLGWPADKFIVAHVGRVSSDKNPMAAVLAVRELESIDAMAVYVGEGFECDQWMTKIRTVGPVTWIREAESMADIYSAIDVLVMASPAEGGPLVVAEAWASGVPVVATPVGIIPEFERRFGALTWPLPVNPSPLQLAAACHAVWSGDTTQRCTRARDAVWQSLSLNRFGWQWEQFLQDCYQSVTSENS